jgi:hypothetical protein
MKLIKLTEDNTNLLKDNKNLLVMESQYLALKNVNSNLMQKAGYF